MGWRTRKTATVLASALALLGGFWFFARHQVQAEQEATAQPPATTASAQPTTDTEFIASTPSASIPKPPALSTPLSERERRWQERDRAWCAQGTQVAAWAMRKVLPDASSKVTTLMWFKDVDAAWQELTREWEQTLRAQADPASQATAEALWILKNPVADASGAVDRLMDLASRSRNAYAAGLATQYACRASDTDPKCQAALKTWLELEPYNLQALQYSPPDRNAEASAVHAYMDRLLSARESRNPREEFIARLWNLEPELPVGLRRASRGVGLIGIWAATSTGSWYRLTTLCKTLHEKGLDTRHCEQVANHLWPLLRRDVTDERLLLALARTFSPPPSHWAPRAIEAEARAQWQEIDLFQQSMQWVEQDLTCQDGRTMQSWARDLFMEGEIAATQTRMPRDPAARAALAQSYRQRTGRGLLDPPAPPKPAQSASR